MTEGNNWPPRASSVDDFEPIGVIDIGSNSVRLVIYEGAIRSPAPLFNEKVLCGLGREIGSTGELGADAVARALAALRRFAAIARVLRVKNLQAIATAAVREAKNGPMFIARGEVLLGTTIQILSGKREAELAAQGIMMGFVDANGIAGDLGGGSLELIDIAGSKLQQGTTLPLGGLRLLESSNGDVEAAVKISNAEFGKVSWLADGGARDFYAVGGTWRSLAKLHMARCDYPLRIMHGYEIATDAAIELCQTIRQAKKLSSVEGMNVVAKGRQEVLPYGAAVLERLLKKLQPRRVIFSVFGIREGLLFSLLSAIEQARDPLLSFCEGYAALRSRSVEQAGELCRWTDAIFSAPFLDETREERRLRHAACLISDIGWRAHPDYRSQHSLNMIAHGALGGIDHPGRVFIALTLYFRHEGPGGGGAKAGGLPERLRPLVDKRTLKRAKILGAAIRAAHMVSLGSAGVLNETPARLHGEDLVLALPPHYVDLDGERLHRRFQTLAGLLDKGFKVEQLS